jgi:protein-tyrosine phosphatase
VWIQRLRQAAGSSWRQHRDALDRLLHPWRRRRAVKHIARVQPRSVLFVCLGNICRSPFAEVALSHRLTQPHVKVTSCGFIGPNRSSPERAQAAATVCGLDLSNHRSKTITEPMIERADLVVVMESSHRRRLRFQHRVPADRIVLLGDLDSEPISRRAIDDPYGRTEEVFVECYRRIDRCVGALADALQIQPCHQ